MVTLTGIDPNSPIPGILRELLFAQGESSTGPGRNVLLYGHKASGGTETANEINEPIADSADMEARFGKRSQLNYLYKKYVAIDKFATIYAVAVPAPTGSVASQAINITAAPTGPCNLLIEFMGESAVVGLAGSETIEETGDAVAAAFNGLADGSLPFAAVNAIDGGGPDYDVTVSCEFDGLHFDHAFGDTAGTYGLRLRVLSGAANAPTTSKDAFTAGTGAPDATTAIAAMKNGEYYYQVWPFQQNETDMTPPGLTTAISATDNMLGELTAAINSEALPTGGKEMMVVSAFNATPAAAQAAAIALNSVRARVVHARHSDWMPGQLAAHYCAALRSQQLAHPCANMADYTNDSANNLVFQVPDPFTKSNRLTRTEIAADLNNGVTPIGNRANGRSYIVRDITTRSQDAAGKADYRARPGHVVSGIDFTWGVIEAQYSSTKQPFVSDDPTDGQQPLPKTDTPQRLKGLIFGVIDDLAGAKPLGIYEGPILDPARVKEMKDSVEVTKMTAGLGCTANFYTVEHNYKSHFKLSEVGEAY